MHPDSMYCNGFSDGYGDYNVPWRPFVAARSRFLRWFYFYISLYVLTFLLATSCYKYDDVFVIRDGQKLRFDEAATFEPQVAADA